MSPEQERYMAFTGLLQWTQAVISQANRVSEARDRQLNSTRDPVERRENQAAFQTECHYFAVAANKLIEFRDWCLLLGLCSAVDFGAINGFSTRNIKDLRNMREHVVDYFKGDGHSRDRWMFETPEYRADASSIVNTLIGGRLDWLAFSTAVKTLLPTLLAEPVPYPPHV